MLVCWSRMISKISDKIQHSTWEVTLMTQKLKFVSWLDRSHLQALCAGIYLHWKKCDSDNHPAAVTPSYRQLRARRALLLLKDVPLRTRRALSPQTLYSNSALLVLNRTSLNIDSALLALNRRHNSNSKTPRKVVFHKMEWDCGITCRALVLLWCCVYWKCRIDTVKPCYNEDLGTTIKPPFYIRSLYIRYGWRKQRRIKSQDQQN